MSDIIGQFGDLFPNVPTASLHVVARVLAFAMRMSVLRLENLLLRSAVQ